MADLTIRNLTVTPLQLKLVERFEGHAVKGGTNKGNGSVTSRITGIFSSSSVSPDVKSHGDARDSHGVSIHIGRFETCATDIRSPDPGREVVRLTFESDGHQYQCDAPSASKGTIVMKKLDGGPNEYTVVYVQNGCCLSIFSSAHLASWMRELDDKHLLTALSIPGTHNSPTCHLALPSVRCQAVSVREQLDNGVRFFDIRVQVDPGDSKLALVHSAFPISLTGTKYFQDLLEDVYQFLQANPSETLIMSVKREGTGKGTDQQLSKYLRDRYCQDASRWYTEPRIPTLGDARGKIVLLRRYINDEELNREHGGKGFGLDCSVWPDNCEDEMTDSKIARIQDFYEVDQRKNIQKKIEYVRCHLERAGEPIRKPGDGKWPFFVNFLSASNFFNANCWPENIAAKVNPAIIEYVCMRHGEAGKGPKGLAVGDACTGIVVTDWVGQSGDWDLIRCIVGWNAKLQLKQ